MKVECAQCGNILNRKPSRVALYGNQFCDRICLGKYKTSESTKVVECGFCKKVITKLDGELSKSKSGKAFCSSSCAASYNGTLFIGENAKNWNNGGDSYRITAFRNLEHKCNRCGYEEHIGILEVHHTDCDRSNNDIKNLEILCPNCHTVEHLINMKKAPVVECIHKRFKPSRS